MGVGQARRGLTRRQVVQRGAALGAGSVLADPFVKQALAAPARCGSLKDIEHIMILVQENRSFDHYFGTYKGVAGFQDRNAITGVFGQAGYPTPTAKLYPFHIDTAKGGECTNDIDHGWGPQHTYWD